MKKPERLSRTSQLIAASLVLAARRRELAPYIPPEDLKTYRTRLPYCGRYTRRLLTLTRFPWSYLAGILERVLLPGIVTHYVVRKRILRECAEHAVRTEGIAQCVIVGAGLDLLGRHLAKTFPGLSVFETDREESITLKKQLLGEETFENLSLLPLELRSSCLTKALHAAQGFQKANPTMVVVEGVLMYLPNDEVHRFFRDLRELLSPPLPVIFTFMEADSSGQGRFHRQNSFVDWWLARAGEPFRWAATEDDLRSLLNDEGMRLEKTISSADYSTERRLFPDTNLWPARGEMIGIARSH